jgi:hypothetical protein
MDPLLTWMAWECGRDLSFNWFFYIHMAVFCFSKVVKLVGLFMREPLDVIYLPISIIFGYFHGFIKIYAAFTLNTVSTHATGPRGEHG